MRLSLSQYCRMFMFHNFPKCLIMAINHSILSGRFIIRPKLKWTNGAKLVNEINYWNSGNTHLMNQLDWHCKRVNQKLLVLSVFVTEFSLWKMNNEKKRISIFKAMLFTLFFSSIVARAILFVYVRNELKNATMIQKCHIYRNAHGIPVRFQYSVVVHCVSIQLHRH